MDIRDRIRAVIEQSDDLTVRNVSLRAGLSDSALHKFLSGATNSMTLETVNNLAKALRVNPAWLAHGEGDPDEATPVEQIFERIPKERQALALRVLEDFARTGTDD